MRVLLRLLALVLLAGLAWHYLIEEQDGMLGRAAASVLAELPAPFAVAARWLGWALLVALGLAVLAWLHRTALWLLREARETFD